MPRLGDDPNMATAYPDRVNTNLRGGWLRQMLYTMVMTLVLYKVVFTDYKSATKESMAKKGISEEAQERIIPKTTAEKAREIKMAKLSQAQKIQALTYEVGNLTNAVTELQKLAVDHYDVTLQHPITLGEKQEGDEGPADGDAAQQAGAGGDESGNPPTVNLRGSGADGGSTEGGGGGDGDGGDGDGADAGGEGTRRLLTREKRGWEEDAWPGEARDEPAVLRGGSAVPPRLKGSPWGEG